MLNSTSSTCRETCTILARTSDSRSGSVQIKWTFTFAERHAPNIVHVSIETDAHFTPLSYRSDGHQNTYVRTLPGSSSRLCLTDDRGHFIKSTQRGVRKTATQACKAQFGLNMSTDRSNRKLRLSSTVRSALRSVPCICSECCPCCYGNAKQKRKSRRVAWIMRTYMFCLHSGALLTFHAACHDFDIPTQHHQNRTRMYTLKNTSLIQQERNA